ncbi:MAG TPA: CBS domain-containing protein [Firmicutes bacterium]|nr:CBS domain-containing protein [Candidatus Fermentithermobacillaceae bacterium]
MFVKDIMTHNPVSISPEATLRELLSVMTDKTFEAIPVKKNGKVVGIVTDWDIVVNYSNREAGNYLDSTRVKDVMTSNVATVSPDEIVEMAAYHMYFHDLDAIPVVDEKDNLVGIVTQSDLFRTFVTLMGLRTRGTRITLDVPDKVGILAEITRIVKDAGISIASLSTYTPPEKKRGNVILRVKTGHVKELVDKFIDEGFHVVHVSQVWE